MVGRFIGSAILRIVSPGLVLLGVAVGAAALTTIAAITLGVTSGYALIAVGLMNRSCSRPFSPSPARTSAAARRTAAGSSAWKSSAARSSGDYRPGRRATTLRSRYSCLSLLCDHRRLRNLVLQRPAGGPPVGPRARLGAARGLADRQVHGKLPAFRGTPLDRLDQRLNERPPAPLASWVTVLSGGLDRLAAGMSSNPTIATCCGIARPSFWSACMAPIRGDVAGGEYSVELDPAAKQFGDCRARRFLARSASARSRSSGSIPRLEALGNNRAAVEELGVTWLGRADEGDRAPASRSRCGWARRIRPARCRS